MIWGKAAYYITAAAGVFLADRFFAPLFGPQYWLGLVSGVAISEAVSFVLWRVAVRVE